MHLTLPTALLSALLTLAIAIPLNTTDYALLDPRGGRQPRFKIHLWNNCPFPKAFAIYSVTPSFKMLQHTPTVNLAHGESHTFHPRFHAIGMRLAGHAERGVDGQWMNQALFEFGYSKYAGKEGTAYDVSIMEGSDRDIGVGAYPISNPKGSGKCRDFTCFPWYCPPNQGWTKPEQDRLGSPADTVCYEGKTDFKVVFCP